MTGKGPSLIFIPDISGFTDFVNKTEASHSRHIIAELLENIINSNKLGLVVSEIEGDAILFYRKDVPSFSEVVDQCQHMFKEFHSHLRKYDAERICRCGACETASSLSLKFVVHAGVVETMTIKEHQKLHGSDVILAHRLLKNSIKDKEYILISDSIDIDSISQTNMFNDWIQIKPGKETFEGFEDTSYSYISLKELHGQIPERSEIDIPGLSTGKVKYESVISAPVDLIYKNFTDLEKRQEWNEDIRNIILKDGKLNKTGSIHTCLVGPYSLEFESLGRKEDEQKIVYGERLNKFRGLRDIISIYTFERKGNQTYIKAEVDFKVKNWFGKVMKPLIRKMILKQTEDGLQKLKKVSEKSNESTN